jgi:nucleotide-binding universal stress UspA family protein
VLCDYRREQDIDLLIMGAYGHSVIRRFLVGSTTTHVIRNATVPVLLLR